MDRDIKPPQKTISNEIHDYLKGILGNVSLGAINPLLDYVFPSYHLKEIEKWRNEIYKTLSELSIKFEQFDKEALRNNPEFTSILIQSIQIASKNAQAEKLAYLRNAIINTPLLQYEFDLKQLFLRYIDELTVTHITILSNIIKSEDILNKPSTFEILFNKYTTIYPFELEQFVFIICIKDLDSRRLIRLSPDYQEEKKEVFRTKYEKASTRLPVKNPLKLPYLKVQSLGFEFLEFINEEMWNK